MYSNSTVMISVDEARELVRKHAVFDKKATLPLLAAAGSVLSASVYSPIDTPPFHQSAMDGYAFSYSSWDGTSALRVVGEVKAGQSFNVPLEPGEAMRIFTGAPMPPGTDTVVIQEKIKRVKDQMAIQDDRLGKGSNVRHAGSQTKKDALALEAGTLLTPPAISFLASLGIEEVEVFTKPSVSIIITGNELVQPGEQLEAGMIYESNGAGLVAALHQLQIGPVSVIRIEDDRASIAETIRQQLQCDVIVITGGISTGDYDFVKAALEDCGVQEIFHSIKQKPGKPFYFGTVLHAMVFALPGNPAAVLTCFYEFIAPAIGQLTHRDYFKRNMIPLLADHKKKAGMTHFLKAKRMNNGVMILPDQESYKMNSFALADCIVELEAEKEFFENGEMVKITEII